MNDALQSSSLLVVKVYVWSIVLEVIVILRFLWSMNNIFMCVHVIVSLPFTSVLQIFVGTNFIFLFFNFFFFIILLIAPLNFALIYFSRSSFELSRHYVVFKTYCLICVVLFLSNKYTNIVTLLLV